MSAQTLAQYQRRIAKAFETYAQASSTAAGQLTANLTVRSGKLYEAHVLGLVAEKLVTAEGVRLRLVGGTHVTFKGSPGPINRGYPYIEVVRNGSVVGEIWTDVEVTGMSYGRRVASGWQGPPELGEYHEMDLLLTDPGLATGERPAFHQVYLAVECKHTRYAKGLLREVLGVRRELSLLRPPQPTVFSAWPAPRVPADPPSCLLVYCADPSVQAYSRPRETFGIEFVHAPL